MPTPSYLHTAPPLRTAMQNITMTSCGVLPDVDHTYVPLFATFMILAIIAVAIRFANRFYTTGQYGWDDWFLALALVWTFPWSAPSPGWWLGERK